MYTKLSFWVAATLLLCCGCKKAGNTTERPSAILQAQAFFNQTIAGSGKRINPDNYRAKQNRTVDWGRATVQQLLTDEIIVAPIRFTNTLLVATSASPERAFNLNDLTYLVVAVDNDRLKRAYTVTVIPDTMNQPGSPSGYYFVEDWQGNSLLRPVHRVKNGNVPSAGLSRSANAKEADYVYNITTCTEIDGYNYSPDDPDGGYSWSETTCTSYSLVADGSDAGSTIPDLPGTGAATSVVIAVAPPGNPIANIVDYLSCFSNGSYPDHTYSVQVCVDQPSPGTRQAWGFTSGGPAGSSAAGNIVNTGHVFLVFSENDQGTVISRNLGFYPSSIVYPTTSGAVSQGRLGNDQSHAYNISLTVQLTSSQFFSMINYASLGNNPGFDYNLSTNNCTTFAINAIAAGGVYLPSTKGTWPGGSGNDPGDMGEDIRSMPLSSNMSRNTVENSHPNTGSCNLN